MRKYAVIIEKGTDSWGAYAPDLPGLGAAGATREEVEQLIREGIDYHLEGLLLQGEPIPEPTSEVMMIATNVVESWMPELAKTA